MSSILPMMFDVTNKNILLIGGGNIAYEKLTRICELVCSIKIIAKEMISPMIELANEHNIIYEIKAYTPSDLDSVDIVIVAIDDIELQKEIYHQASKQKILCNAVDLAHYCHFLFPAIVRRGDLIVSISTSGASPAFAKYFKKFIEHIIPHNVSDFLIQMRALRDELPKGKERMRLLNQKAKVYIEKHLL